MTPKCACPFQISSPNAFFLQMFTNDLHPNNFALFIVFPIPVNTTLSLQFFKPKTIVLSPFISHSIFCSSRKHGDTTFKMYPKSHHVSSPPLLTAVVPGALISSPDYCSELLMVSLLLLLAPSVYAQNPATFHLE